MLERPMLERFEKPDLPIGVHSPGHVAATDEQAKEEHFEQEAGPDGALYVGAPGTVAAKIVNTMKLLGLSRFEMKYSNGTMPHDKLMTSIELYGTKVLPRVREQLA